MVLLFGVMQDLRFVEIENNNQNMLLKIFDGLITIIICGALFVGIFTGLKAVPIIMLIFLILIAHSPMLIH